MFWLVSAPSGKREMPTNSTDVESHSPDPIVDVWLEFLAEFADFYPGFKIIGRGVSVLDMDDFSEFAKEQRKGPLDVHNANR